MESEARGLSVDQASELMYGMRAKGRIKQEPERWQSQPSCTNVFGSSRKSSKEAGKEAGSSRKCNKDAGKKCSGKEAGNKNSG